MKKSYQYILILLLFVSNVLYSQTNTDLVVAKKRALFITNIASQISGYKKSSKKFVIGVLKNKTTARALLALSLKRKIDKRYIEIKLIDNLNNFKGIDLLYVKKSSNFQLDPIMFRIIDYPTLLISEDYNSDTSMINISKINDDFFIDINIPVLTKYGFKASSTLLETSLKSVESWKKLYAKTKIVEQEQKQILIEKQQELKEQKQEVFIKEIEVFSKDLKIEEGQKKVEALQKISKNQQKKFIETTDELELLEDRYSIQKELVLSKENELSDQKELIEKQSAYLQNQSKKIQLQKEILGEQQEKLSMQHKINWLLIALVLSILSFSIYFYKARQTERGLVTDLALKNEEIAKKSKVLQRQNNELEQFAFIASHDLQEPLHTVTSFSNFLLEDYYDKLDDSGKENLTYIKEGCDRMSILIRSLLDYSRIGINRKLEIIDSQKLVRTIIKNFNAKIRETSTEITFGEMPEIKGYRIELGLLFQNLISNAIKFKKSKTNPKIHISGKKIESTVKYSHRWEFKVADNGIGVPKKFQSEIFNIFKRLHSKDQYSGTGIGLAHCKKIVGLHHGELDIKSKKDQGSTFIFTIQFNETTQVI